MVRMNNLQNDGWDFSELKYISLTDDELTRYRLEVGDLLFNRTNSKELVGKCERFAEHGDWAFASYLIRVRLDPSKVQSQYVSDFLGTRAGRLQIDRMSRQIIGMTNINAEELKDIQLPLPPLAQQNQLVASMNAARTKRRAKLAEADALLAGLDGFLLAALGISVPRKDERKVFAVTLGGVRTRVDADFHSPRFRAIRDGIERGTFVVRPLSDLCIGFESGFAAGQQDQAFDYDTGVPHLRPLNLSAQGELSLESTKWVPKLAVSARDHCHRGEVLFNNTNSAEMVGKSAVFEFEQPCACSNHMTRLRTRDGVSPYYLATLFNALRSLGYLSLLATKFNNQAGINLDTLRPLRIPAPPLAVQETIAAEARRRRDEARRLRREAEGDWQDAKRWFEAQLLG